MTWPMVAMTVWAAAVWAILVPLFLWDAWMRTGKLKPNGN